MRGRARPRPHWALAHLHTRTHPIQVLSLYSGTFESNTGTTLLELKIAKVLCPKGTCLLSTKLQLNWYEGCS